MNINLPALYFQGFMKTQWHVSSQIGSIIPAASLAYLLQANFMLSAHQACSWCSHLGCFIEINGHSRHVSATAKDAY